MYYNCSLLIGGKAYSVTDDLKNWDDVTMTFKRGNYDGVIRTFSTKFSFANAAYSLIVGEYQKNYLSAKASIVFHKRNNSWLWDEIFRCSLDFGTLNYDGYTCEINAVDDSLASIIKAKRSTQYEYLVSNLKEVKPLKYEHLAMQNKVEWTLPANTDDETIKIATKNGTYALPLYVKASEISSKGVCEFLDASEPTDYFFKNVSGNSLTINVKMEFKIDVDRGVNNGAIAAVNFWFERKKDGVSEVIQREYYTANGTYNISIDRELKLANNEELLLNITTNSDTATVQTIHDVRISPTISYMYQGKGEVIDIIKPSTLLYNLLHSMVGEYISCNIAEDERINKTMLMAADSVRGLHDAKISTSYAKFCDWMSAEFGFVPVVEDKSVSFVHRDTLFKDNLALELGAALTGFDYTVNSGMIYSSVKVGYDKKDYDSVNGLDEFRFTTEYSTGTTLSDNTFNLISPYRADAYGIEFLVNKRGEDTTDNKSDKDIFMAAIGVQTGQYNWLDKSVSVEGVISPQTMFNAIYAATYMIEVNKRYIGAFCKKLTYTSSDGNSDVKVNGVSAKADINITDRLFSVGEVSIETENNTLPKDIGGYIQFEKNGKIYRCYLLDVDFGVNKNRSVKYKLIVKDIS